MATIIRNLDTIISKAINGPKVDDIPLYARVDGEQEIGFDKSSNRSDNWIKASESTFTSPTNIRRILISGTKVAVQTYVPIISRGKPDTKGCWREISLTGDDNITDSVMKSIRYASNMEEYLIDKQMNMDTEEPDRVNIRGTGLSALSKPWVLSNVEEVYFDWTLLASEHFRNAGIGCNELLNTYLQNKRGYLKLDIPLDMLLYANNLTIENLRDKFPRLRYIGLISELSTILNMKYEKGKSIMMDDKNIPWATFKGNIDLIKRTHNLLTISELESIDETSFAIRQGIYRYDRDILKPFIDKYIDKIKRGNEGVSVGSGGGGSGAGGVESVVGSGGVKKNALEDALNDIEARIGLNELKRALMIALAGEKIDTINNMIDEMSTIGKEKYSSILNIGV